MPYRTIREILDIARDAEDRASRFYEHAGGLVREDRAGALLRDLAQEERKHVEMLEAFCPGPAGRMIVPFEPALLKELVSDREVSAESSLRDIYEGVLEWEERTVTFYDQIVRNVQSDAVSELFSALRTYELGHLDLVNRMYAYYRSNREEVR